MRKLLLNSLILFFSCTSLVWAVSQEQYGKYHSAKMNGDFGEIMEVVNHIVATEDPNKLTVNDFEILSVAVAYHQQFNYVFKSEEMELFKKFIEFSDEPKNKNTRTVDFLGAVWWMGFSDKPSGWVDILSRFELYSLTDVQGGISPHVVELINWKLGTFHRDSENFVEAEMRYLGYISNHLNFPVAPWEAALWLSRISYLYHAMGNSDLALSTAISANEILSKLNRTPHLYLSEIVQNLSHIAALNGAFETADHYLSLLQLQSKQTHQYKNNSAELNIATTEAYLAFRTLEAARLEKARARHDRTNWEFNEIDIDVFFNYVDSYITNVKSSDCSNQAKFDINSIGKQSIGNVLRVLELDKSTLCGDFSGAQEALKDFNQNATESLAASYKGLSRSMQSYNHSLWAEEIVLKALLRIQKNQGVLSEDLIDEVIEIFLKLESSPAERELSALALAKENKSPFEVNALRTYFNLLREREIYVSNLVKVYTRRTLVWLEAGFPTGKAFSSPGSALQRQILATRDRVEKFLITPVAKTSSDISRNLLADQAAVFNVVRGGFQLSCLISTEKKYCEVSERDSSYNSVATTIVDAINKRRLKVATKSIQKITAIKFPSEIKRLASNYQEIFYVPSSDDWNLPLNLIWAALDIPATLIITPTLSGLAHRDGPNNSNQAKYSYAGIGNPNYSVKSLAALTDLQEINGFKLRSAEYISQLSQLTQLPATEEEILSSERNFRGNTRVILGVDANEDYLLDTDWYDSDIIHFATHALISGEMSGLEEPAIALSNPDANSYQDGLLTATDIRGYNFPNSTVILSGCRTATDYGKSARDGITGLSLAFLLQGAKNLVVTQWQIPDEFSAQIMSKATLNLSIDPSAASLKKVVDSISSTDIDPFNWAAYVYISLPSRYNKNRIAKTQKFKIGVLANQETTDFDVSSEKIDGTNYVMVSYTAKSDENHNCDIYENSNNELTLKSKISGYRHCYFIGPKDERFVYLTSSFGLWIGRLNSSLSRIEKKIQLVDSSNMYITHFTKPAKTETGFIMAYRAEKVGEIGAFASLVAVDFALKSIIETDISDEIFMVDSPKNYRHDYTWNMLSDDKGHHIAVTRTFIVPKFNEIEGSWDYPHQRISYFYHFAKNRTFVGYYQVPLTRVIDVLRGHKSLFIGAHGDQDNLSFISTKGEISNLNNNLSNVVAITQFESKNRPLIGVSTQQTYSQKSYFNILNSSMDLIPFEPFVPEKSDASWTEKIIENSLKEEIPYGVRERLADKWIYQVSIIDPESDNLTIEKIFPSTPISRMAAAFIIDENNQTRIDMVNFNRLEYQQSPL